MPNAHKAYGEVSCEVNAAKKRGRTNHKIDGNRCEAQRGVLDGYSKDGAFYYGEQTCQCQCSGAEHCHHGRKNSYAHQNPRAAIHFIEKHEKCE